MPIFQYDYRCRYLQDIEAYKESCDLADNINPIELSEPELEKSTTEQFIFQNFGDKDFNTIIYNENWIKIADSSNLFLSTDCLLYTSPSPRDRYGSRMPSSA